jgi:Zn-dependent oligopeptidase
MRDFVGIPARIDEFYASDEAFVGTMIEIADRGEKVPSEIHVESLPCSTGRNSESQ